MDRAKAIRKLTAQLTDEKDAAGSLVAAMHSLHALAQAKRHVLTGYRDAWLGDVLANLHNLALSLDPDLRYCEHREVKLGACIECGLQID